MDRRTNYGPPAQKFYPRVRPEDTVEDPASAAKKKTKKWSFGGLFKRRRTKSSDTDSSSDLDEKKKGFLTRRSTNHKGGSHKVVGKFETIIMPRNEPQRSERPITTYPLNSIEKYDASPNVIPKRNNHNAVAFNGHGSAGNGNCVFHSSQEIPVAAQRPDSLEFAKGSSGSLDAASRRGEKQRMKARVAAMRDRLRDSSSSDECGDSSRTSNCSSSLQRLNAEARDGGGSLSRRSRAARTDRYIRRHFKENEGPRCCSSSDPRLTSGQKSNTPVGSPRSRWVAKVVYQQSNDYPTRYTARTQSATSSPMSSPLTRPRNFQCSSLPGKNSSMIEQNRELFQMLNDPPEMSVHNASYNDRNSIYGRVISPKSCESLPKVAPPPPPRNPNRKIIPADKGLGSRPSSYAFDANTRHNDIVAYVSHNRPVGFRAESHPTLKSSSELELRKNDQLRQKSILRQAIRSDDTRSFGNESTKKYCADRSPRSRNPIQLMQTENVLSEMNSISTNSDPLSQAPISSPVVVTQNCPLSLSKANVIGIPVPGPDEPVVYSRSVSNLRKSTPEPATRGRPLSIVSEKSDYELLTESSLPEAPKPAARLKPKPKNLEEALVELEEIYNSLKLSDEDLLDRADLRDLQSAIRMNPNFSRHSWNDLDDAREDQVDGAGRRVTSSECLYSPDDRYLYSPRLATSRRSAVPDTVADDMAYRKLHKKETQDPRSTPNVVSQSGSFLLMSPALSPPPLVDIQPAVVGLVAKEPDITLDDVVFRNIRQANSTLKVPDPQPPFGIPLGPVSPAPNSDYLHAVPGEKYRSTFNPSRTPDVVKDDLAFRQLRKDVHGRPDIARQYMVPSADAKKRRAIRSLSANVVSLLGRHSDNGSDEDATALVDVNCNNLRRSDRCVSFNNLPDILEDYRSQKRALLENCEECLDDRRGRRDASDDRTIDVIAGEAKILSQELRRKLRELEAVPLTNGFDERGLTTGGVGVRQPQTEKDVFRGRVAVHKPITLSQFRIDVNSVDEATECQTAGQTDDGGKPTASAATEEHERGQEFGLKNLCQNLNWMVCGAKQTVPSEGECGAALTNEDSGLHKSDDNAEDSGRDKSDDNAENSSSGVSSTSDTPDSSHRCGTNPVSSNFYSGAYRAFPVDSPSPCEEPSSSVRDTCELLAQEQFPGAVTNGGVKMSQGAGGGLCGPPRAKKCSRIEITLSTPEPTGSR